jgi:hypothetical protein
MPTDRVYEYPVIHVYPIVSLFFADDFDLGPKKDCLTMEYTLNFEYWETFIQIVKNVEYT